MTTHAAPPRRGPSDGGFLLLELVAVMAVAGTLLGIGLWGFASHQRGAELQGTHQELVSRLRGVADRAVTEGRTHCVALEGSGRAYSVWRGTCGTGTLLQGPLRTRDDRVSVTAVTAGATPAPACSAAATCVYFSPRGTATPAELTVRSTARPVTYTVRVEGLTGRVW